MLCSPPLLLPHLPLFLSAFAKSLTDWWSEVVGATGVG